MRAVITAGGRVVGAFAAALGTTVKALAPFRGSTVLERTIAAARGAGMTRIALVGGPEVQAACGSLVDRFIHEEESGAANQRLALRAWDEGEPLLYLTSDMPFLDARALLRFSANAPPDALCLPLTEFADFERRFPDAPPFGITLAGRRVVNGGAFIIPAGAAGAVERLALRFFDARKNPLRMAGIAGTRLLVRFLARRLSVDDLESRAQHLLDIPARAVRGAPPELAYDIDALPEYEYARAHA